MALLLIDRPVATTAHDTDQPAVAAWTLRHANGRVTNWRATGLERSLVVAAWAVVALADGGTYADLLFSELALLA